MDNKFSSFFIHVSAGGGRTRSVLDVFQGEWSRLITGKTVGGILPLVVALARSVGKVYYRSIRKG